MAVKINQAGLPLQVSAGDQAFMPLESYDFERLKSNSLELQKIDIFSLGLILYLMMIGRPAPLTGREWAEHRDPAVLRARLGPLPYSERLKELVLRCLSVSPIERPSADHLQTLCCLIRRDSEAADQIHSLRQAATLNRRLRDFQSTVHSPTTSSQFVSFPSSTIFQGAEQTPQHADPCESFPRLVFPGPDHACQEAANRF